MQKQKVICDSNQKLAVETGHENLMIIQEEEIFELADCVQNPEKNVIQKKREKQNREKQKTEILIKKRKNKTKRRIC